MRLALQAGIWLWSVHVVTVPVMAQPAAVKGIYVCTDSSGRNLKSDRPIAQCADREQRILGPSGVERSRIGPVLSEAQAAQRLEKQRAEQLAAQRMQEQRRRDALLLQRYPNQGMHDAARAAALEQPQALHDIAQSQMADLVRAKLALQQDLAFYANDASKAPANWHRAVQELEQAQQEQRKVLSVHTQEAQRIHLRFDAELQRLQPLWQAQKSMAEALAGPAP